MTPRGSIVLIDTVAIKAAHDHGCWNALKNSFQLHSVPLCLEEATRWSKQGRRLVAKSCEELSKELTLHTPSEQQRAELLLRVGLMLDLDAGERDLLADALTLKSKARWLCGPDKASLKALNRLQLLDRMVALETLARGVGCRTSGLKDQYTEKWLGEKRLRLRMGDELI